MSASSASTTTWFAFPSCLSPTVKFIAATSARSSLAPSIRTSRGPVTPVNQTVRLASGRIHLTASCGLLCRFATHTHPDNDGLELGLRHRALLLVSGITSVRRSANHLVRARRCDQDISSFSRNAASQARRLVEGRKGQSSLPRPTFGENLTTIGMLEDGVYVGDRFRVGKAVICVTQPTERCKAIGRSLGVPKILKILHELEVCGFYARVVEAGHVVAGDTAELCDRSQSTWSVKRLHHFMFHELADDQLVNEVLAVPELSGEWKRRVGVMRGRLWRGEPLSSNLVGL
jgi:MOSC domain-containing protein YiiM